MATYIGSSTVSAKVVAVPRRRSRPLKISRSGAKILTLMSTRSLSQSLSLSQSPRQFLSTQSNLLKSTTLRQNAVKGWTKASAMESVIAICPGLQVTRTSEGRLMPPAAVYPNRWLLRPTLTRRSAGRIHGALATAAITADLAGHPLTLFDGSPPKRCAVVNRSSLA